MGGRGDAFTPTRTLPRQEGGHVLCAQTSTLPPLSAPEGE
jgi:hypothetical protein